MSTLFHRCIIHACCAPTQMQPPFWLASSFPAIPAITALSKTAWNFYGNVQSIGSTLISALALLEPCACPSGNLKAHGTENATTEKPIFQSAATLNEKTGAAQKGNRGNLPCRNSEQAALAGRLELGGTFAVFLGCDALRKGYRATIYTYNLGVFDPTWFAGAGVDIADRLSRQREFKTEYRLQQATMGYLEFLQLGGKLRFLDLSRGLIHGMLRRKLPIITGLSSTYLYRTLCEYGPDDTPDDVRGVPAGHFVVIGGYDLERHKVLVMDPYQKNPYGQSHEYWIGIDRVIGAIHLGIVTHDANLLIIHPRHSPRQALP